MITQKAMLAAVHISIWTATKHDRKVSRDVADRHGARERAGRYNKQLLMGAGKLEDLRTLAGQIRQHFYKITLPWSDEGFRLLPSHFLFDLTARMREFEVEFSSGVDQFLGVYPDYIREAKAELGSLFREEDYPTVDKLREKFSVKLEILPVPTGGIGQVLDAPAPEDADGKTDDEQARDWQIAVEQAETLSKLAGKVPAGLDRCLEGAEEARVDWRELLRRSWSQTSAAEYSWLRPNRRHIWQGLYLPGVVREGVGVVVIAVDCSGSVNARQLSLFEAEIQSILEGQRPEVAHVLYFDTCVHKVDAYQAGQPIKLTPVGGGGTDFRPCFDWVAENGLQPEMMVFLTDLYGTLPNEAPPYPVLWASTGSRRAAFGEVVPMHAA